MSAPITGPRNRVPDLLPRCPQADLTLAPVQLRIDPCLGEVAHAVAGRQGALTDDVIGNAPGTDEQRLRVQMLRVEFATAAARRARERARIEGVKLERLIEAVRGH